MREKLSPKPFITRTLNSKIHTLSDVISIVLQASKNDETVVNVGTRGIRGQQINQETLWDNLKKSDPVFDAAKCHIPVEKNAISFSSPRLDIDLSSALTPIRDNASVVSDAAAAGSPIGGLGAGLAISHYPEAALRLIHHSNIDSDDPKKTRELERRHSINIAQIAEIRHGELGKLMTNMGFYSDEINRKRILKYAVATFPESIHESDNPITNPSHPHGEGWLRSEFEKILNNVQDEASKPSPELLEKLISDQLDSPETRTPSDVYWEHIFLRYAGQVERDIERNYSENLSLSLIGTENALLHGHAGIKKSAEILNSLLSTTEYTIIDTVIRTHGKSCGWVTERWGYFDKNTKKEVIDGIDSFLIKDGKIETKLINYTVQEGTNFSDFQKKIFE